MNNKVVSWDSITENEQIPEIIKMPTYMQLFMFSAVTWNRHLIHYNAEYAHHDGLSDVAVHRALLGNFLTQLMTDWIGESGKISKVDWNVRSSAKPGDTLYCRGHVVKKEIIDGCKFVECDIRIEKEDGTLIAPGKGKVQLLD